MREALTVLFDLAFSDPSVTSIDSGVVNDNPASLKLQAGLGFEVTGEMETESVPRKTQVQMITTVLIRETWSSRSESSFSATKPSGQLQSSQFAA